MSLPPRRLAPGIYRASSSPTGAAPPVFRPPRSLPILPKFYQGPRLPVAGPPPVYRPGGQATLSPLAPVRARPSFVQPSLLEEYRKNRDIYTNALVKTIRGITTMVAKQIVHDHPPDDQYFAESLQTYVGRIKWHLEAEGFHDRDKEWDAIANALKNYREGLVEIQREAQLQKEKSNTVLAEFEKAADEHKQQLIRKVKAHIFGAEVKDSHPSGLHAYTKGTLPYNVKALLTAGDVKQVHILVWTAEDADGHCKWSSMFPKEMPAGMVCWYVLNKRDNGHYPIGKRPTVLPFVWPAINLGQSGDTNYPEYPGGEAAARLAIAQAAGNAYSTTTENKIERYHLTSGDTEYTFSN